MGSADIAARLQDAADTFAKLTVAESVHELTRAAELVADAVLNDRCLFVFGNGGSAADAAHLAAELVGRCTTERRPLPAVALTESGSLMTALANDYGYEQVFARQIESLGKPGDVAMGLSTSGRSANVIAGLRAARDRGMTTIGMTGEGTHDMSEMVDCLLIAPSTRTPRIQECHHLWAHLIAEHIDLRVAKAQR